MIFEWGDDELAHFLELAKSRELVEQRGCVFSEFRMGREQAVVGACAGRGGIVIAGAQMEIVPDAIVFLPHNQAEFCVNLESDQAEGDIHAGLLQFAAQKNLWMIRHDSSNSGTTQLTVRKARKD